MTPATPEAKSESATHQADSDLIDLHGPLAVAENTNDEPAGAGPQQRRAPRVRLGVEIGIDDHTNFYVGFSENVSEGGLFIATYTLLPVGTEVALTFVLQDELPLFVHGFVRWVRDPDDLATSPVPPGMGVEFTDLGDAEKQRLQAFIEACR